MSTDRDVTRIVRSWLHEDAYEDADRILNLVLDEIDTTPQRSAPWLTRRFPIMNSTFRVGIAAVAVVIAAILGFTYLNNQVGTDSPTPTPSSTAIPTATPVAIPPLPPWGAPALDPGRYTVAVPGSTGVTVAFTVGDGWTPGGWYIMNPPDFSKQVSFWTVDNVYEDLCDRESLPDPAIGPSVDDLVAALDAQAKTDMSPAVDVELGGFAGKRVTMAAAETAQCFEIGTLSLTYFVASSNPGGVEGRELDHNSMDTLWIIDVDGQRVVIATSRVDPEDTDATTTIAGVMDSIEFVAP
jgi:hypothetical protein